MIRVFAEGVVNKFVGDGVALLLLYQYDALERKQYAGKTKAAILKLQP
jgi:hypothetical protein